MKIAEDFGNILWPKRNILDIKDLMLFGSVAYGGINPKDLDVLILHGSTLLERFQEIAYSKIPDSEKLSRLSNQLKEKIDLIKLLRGTQIEKLICENRFNSYYMHTSFFNNEIYREEWILRNRKHSQKQKGEFSKKPFEETIFEQGLLWNPKNKRYDLPAQERYKIPSLIFTSPQNQLSP